jgi:hypothetical protein
MKKTLLLAGLMLVAANSAFAATTISTGGVTTPGAALYGGTSQALADGATNPIVKFSTGVIGGTAFNTSAYAVMTKHSKGSKIFGTANDSTSIFWKQVAAGDLATGDVGTTSGNTAFSGTTWTTY